ncbi:MAG TPA: hypothetical protein VIR00_04145 [Micromonosporaceae bacterium]|jgi:hypothetical protein
MSHATEEINWSDLARDPGRAGDLVESNGEVIVKRRGQPDLALVRADRHNDWRGFMADTAQLLRNFITRNGVDAAAESIVDLYAWTEFLPIAERKTFVNEYVRILRATADVGVPSAIARFINEWRATAAIYADPHLLAILTATEGVDDFGRVKPPQRQRRPSRSTAPSSSEDAETRSGAADAAGPAPDG